MRSGGLRSMGGRWRPMKYLVGPKGHWHRGSGVTRLAAQPVASSRCGCLGEEGVSHHPHGYLWHKSYDKI